MLQDLRFAARLLRKSPGFTLAAVVTLGLGIGGNATIFSLADATFLRALPLKDAERLVHVYQRRPTNRAAQMSYADYLDYREQSRSFDALAAQYSTSPMHVVFNGEPAALTGAVVTASYFDVLGLHAALGRFFAPEEDRAPDRDAVAVISHGLWRRRFGGTADAVGRTLHVNGRSFSVVGVAPEGFAGVRNGGPVTEVWIPAAMFRVGYRYCDAFDRACTIVDLIGKLRPGVSREEAQRELDVIAGRLRLAHPATNTDLGVTVAAARGLGRDATPDETRQLQLLLFGVGLVLLIACANVAALLLARAIRRRGEIALRYALGATRGRVVRQLFSESLLIAVLGAGTGLLFAVWGTDLLSTFHTADYAGRPRDFHADLSWRVIAAATAVTALASLLFGLVPALHGSKLDVMPILKDEGASGGWRRARLRQLLVVGQIALSVMLVIGAGLLVRSVRNVIAGPGFDPRPVITLRLRPSLVNYPTAKAAAFHREIIRRLEALPGVVSASPGDGIVTNTAPTGGDQVVAFAGTHGERQDLKVRVTRVGPRYFATLGVPILEGREFSDQDRENAPKVVVVNDVLARRLASNLPVTGGTLVVRGEPHRIVGVVKDAQYHPGGQVPDAVAYRSYWQPNEAGMFGNDSRTVVRVAGDAGAMMTAIRREVVAADASVPISEDYPLISRVGFEFRSVLMARAIFVALGAVALFLSAIGVYGVLAFTVGERTREMAIRMALGAERGDVARLVLHQGLAVALTGATIGVAAAWFSMRLVTGLLYGVASNDAWTFAIAPVVLVLVALVASYLPALRATRVSPVAALRHE